MKFTKYHPEMAQIFMSMSSEGYAMTEIAAELMVVPDTLKSWSLDPEKPEFKEAYELGQVLREAYYHKMARSNMTNREFKEGLFKFITGVMFRWSDKQEVQTTTKHDPSETEEKLKKYLSDPALKPLLEKIAQQNNLNVGQ